MAHKMNYQKASPITIMLLLLLLCGAGAEDVRSIIFQSDCQKCKNCSQRNVLKIEIQNIAAVTNQIFWEARKDSGIFHGT